MYQISRSIYRRLASRVISDPADPTGSRNRLRLLQACEAAMERMAEDRRYFARPERSLFEEIRGCFTLGDQVLVYMVVEHHIELADEYLALDPQLRQRPLRLADAAGQRLRLVEAGQEDGHLDLGYRRLHRIVSSHPGLLRMCRRRPARAGSMGRPGGAVSVRPPRAR